MRGISNSVLLKMFFFSLGVIYAILEYFLQQHTGVFEVIFKGVVISLLLIIMEELFELSSNNSDRSKDRIQKIFVQHSRKITGDVFMSIQRDINQLIRIVDDQLVIEHEAFALSAYDTFWRKIVDNQRRRKQKLTVKAVHSSDIEVWSSHPLKHRLFEHQSQFCELGGKIVRVLCGRGVTPDEKLMIVAEEMRRINVEVRYYNLSSRQISNYNFSWDFARIEETGDVAIWDSFGNTPGGAITEAIFTSGYQYKRQDIAQLWDTIYSQSIPFPFPKEGQNENGSGSNLTIPTNN